MDSLPAELPGNSFYLSLFFPKGKDGAYISEVVAQGDEEHEGTQQRPDPSLFQGLPHFRQILYQLSYQGSPYSRNRKTENESLKIYSNSRCHFWL